MMIDEHITDINTLSSRKLICNLTNESYSFNTSQYEKKVAQYGGEENLRDFFVKPNIINLILKGFSISDISKLLGFEYEKEKEKYYKSLIVFHNNMKNKNKTVDSKRASLLDSDENVKSFIEGWKSYLNN